MKDEPEEPPEAGRRGQDRRYTPEVRIVNQAFALFEVWAEYGTNNEIVSRRMVGLFELLKEFDEDRYRDIFRGASKAWRER